jgi:putative PIN family toxin of toxin-antitoxin system
MARARVVLDTNVFVAAGFNSESSSARLLEEIRKRDLELVWNEATRQETRTVVEKISPLHWDGFVDLFREETRHTEGVDPDEIDYVPDPGDRTFAALAGAADAALITNDDDLLANRREADILIVKPDEYVERRR